MKNYLKNSIIQWFPYSTFLLLHAWVNPYTSLKYLSFHYEEIPNRKKIFSFLIWLLFIYHILQPPTTIQTFEFGENRATINKCDQGVRLQFIRTPRVTLTNWRNESRKISSKNFPSFALIFSGYFLSFFTSLSIFKFHSQFFSLSLIFHPICVLLLLRVEWRDEWNLVEPN